MCELIEGLEERISRWLFEMIGFSCVGYKRINARRPVFEFCDCNGNSVIVKLYGMDPVGIDEKQRRLKKEYDALKYLWEAGLGSGSYRVVKPLGYSAELQYALAEEKASGLNLFEGIRRAIRTKQDLSDQSVGVAELLAKIHSVKAEAIRSWIPDWRRRVAAARVGSMEKELMDTGKVWEAEFPLPLPIVPLHGDPNPTNFARDELALTAFDLQMYHYGYPVEDLGEFAAELKFAFEQYAGNSGDAERYLGSFFRTYAARTGMSFEVLTAYNPFFMGLWELNMASNSWMGQKRTWLIREASKCWRSGLQYLRR
ncbi:aminoglycoside phosphotransferase family protein [Tardisphaera miroshnichenkoae]